MRKQRETRANKVEAEKRVQEFFGLLLDGYTRQQLLKHAEKWDLEARQVDEYASRARALIREQNDAAREDNLATITANLWDLYRFQRVNDVAEARKILMDIAKLRGLEETTVNHILQDRPLEDVSEEELDEVLDGGDGRH